MMKDPELVRLMQEIQEYDDERSLFVALVQRLQALGDPRVDMVTEIVNLKCPDLSEIHWPEDPDNPEDPDPSVADKRLLTGDWWVLDLIQMNPDDAVLRLELCPSSPLAVRIGETWVGPFNIPDDGRDGPWIEADVAYGADHELQDALVSLRLQLLYATMTLMPGSPQA